MPVPAPVTFLMFHAYGRGGVARSVVSLANRLADHREVRVVSLDRDADRAPYPLDPRVRLEVLLDTRPGRLDRGARLLHRQPSRLKPAPVESRMSLLTDRVLRRRLARLEPGVLVSTRPSLHLAATRWAAAGVRLVGQDHGNFLTRFAGPAQAAVLREAVPRLDAWVVLTRADAADYRRELPALEERGTRVEVIRNALPWPQPDAPSPLSGPVVVAAGRLVREKGFGRLVDAFAAVAPARPGWRLHVYGEGPGRAALQARVHRHGLGDRVLLPGHTDDLGGVLAGASVYALTSRSEGFPMVLVEAMGAGLPVVSFDCPRGPAEIVDHGVNGLLVADGDVPGFSDALARLLDDEPLRRRCGAQAWADAHAYTAERVTGGWLALLDSLDA